MRNQITDKPLVRILVESRAEREAVRAVLRRTMSRLEKTGRRWQAAHALVWHTAYQALDLDQPIHEIANAMIVGFHREQLLAEKVSEARGRAEAARQAARQAESEAEAEAARQAASLADNEAESRSEQLRELRDKLRLPMSQLKSLRRACINARDKVRAKRRGLNHRGVRQTTGQA